MRSDEIVDQFREFIPFCAKHLGLDRLPKITWFTHGDVGSAHHSFGSFHNDDQTIRIGITNRHPMDIMRTLAHELTHYKQWSDGRIGDHSGATGSPIENEANATAGIIMRDWGQLHPELFKEEPITEGDAPGVIKLRGFAGDRSKKARQWIDKIYSEFPEWPMDPRQRAMVFLGPAGEQQVAWFELVPSVIKPGAVEVKWFGAQPQRQGVGSKAMRKLQDLATEAGISLTLFPWDKGRISQGNLTKFYKRAGFKQLNKDGKNLIWEPTRQLDEEDTSSIDRILDDLRNHPDYIDSAVDQITYSVFREPQLVDRYRAVLIKAVDERKPEIMKYLLGLLASQEISHENALYIVSPAVRALKMLGMSWPELDVIKRSIDADRTNELDEANDKQEPVMTAADDGAREWRLNDRLHREDGPAIELDNGYRAWYIRGLRHREDGPAIEDADGGRIWYTNGQLNRTDGPAIEIADGRRGWWIKDENLSFSDWLKKTKSTLTKEDILRFLLLMLKQGNTEDVAKYVDELVRQGIDYPEFSMIRRSINNDKPKSLDEISKVELSTNPEHYGANIHQSGKPEKTTTIPFNKIVSLHEPEELGKMQLPKSAANVKRIMAGIKRGDRLPPLLVRRFKNGYQVLDGHHRYEAYKRMRIKQIPVQIVDPKNIKSLDEAQLTHKDPVERWISVFKASKHPKFQGKTPEQRERMARAAQIKAVQNKKVSEGETIKIGKRTIMRGLMPDGELDITSHFEDRTALRMPPMKRVAAMIAQGAKEWRDELVKMKDEGFAFVHRYGDRIGAAFSKVERPDGSMIYFLNTLHVDFRANRFTRVLPVPRYPVVTHRSSNWNNLDKPTPTVADLALKYKASVAQVRAELTKGIRVEKEHTSDPKVAQEIALDHLGEDLYYYEKLARIEKVNEAWSEKYKKSINCNDPKGFSQRAHCAGRKARQSGKKTRSKSVSESVGYQGAVDALIYDVEAAFKDGYPTDAIDAVLESGYSIKDIPQLKKLFDANMPMIAKLLLSEIQEDDMRYPLARVREELETLGIDIPNPIITAALNTKMMSIETRLINMVHKGQATRAILALIELEHWGLDHMSIGYIADLDDADVKAQIIRSMLKTMKDGDVETVRMVLDHLIAAGAGWPELDAFKKSLSGSISENINLIIKEEWDEKTKARILRGHLDGKQYNLLPLAIDHFNLRFDKNAELKKMIDDHATELIAYYDNPAKGSMLGTLYDISRLIVKGYRAPWLIKYLNDNKENVIKTLLQKIKKGYDFDIKHINGIMPKLKKLKLGWPELDIIEKSLRANRKVSENFADGRGPGKPGDSRRHGIPKGATIAQLEKHAQRPGRAGQLARWQLNMRRGKRKAQG